MVACMVRQKTQKSGSQNTTKPGFKNQHQPSFRAHSRGFSLGTASRTSPETTFTLYLQYRALLSPLSPSLEGIRRALDQEEESQMLFDLTMLKKEYKRVVEFLGRF